MAQHQKAQACEHSQPTVSPHSLSLRDCRVFRSIPRGLALVQLGRLHSEKRLELLLQFFRDSGVPLTEVIGLANVFA